MSHKYSPRNKTGFCLLVSLRFRPLRLPGIPGSHPTVQTLMPDSSPLLGPQPLEGGHHSSFICVCLVFSKDSAWKPSIPNTHGKTNKILAPLVAGVLAQGADHSFLGLGEEGELLNPSRASCLLRLPVHFQAIPLPQPQPWARRIPQHGMLQGRREGRPPRLWSSLTRHCSSDEEE